MKPPTALVVGLAASLGCNGFTPKIWKPIQTRRSRERLFISHTPHADSTLPPKNVTAAAAASEELDANTQSAKNEIFINTTM